MTNNLPNLKLGVMPINRKKKTMNEQKKSTILIMTSDNYVKTIITFQKIQHDDFHDFHDVYEELSSC